ncbi:MAG TPA: L-rhamnose mutarotase [Bacteroidota bacterium]|nr:L-rhamnose mutarotase [Bacteroidota bacterium]
MVHMKYFWFLPVFGALVTLAGGSEAGAQQAAKERKPAATRRYCLTLDLKDDTALVREYRYWHMKEHIWPEIPKGIREVGIVDMEIYILGTRLFMIMETVPTFDFDRDMARLSELPRQKEWEAFVAKFQKALPGAKSNEKWKLMERMFKLP